MSLQKLRLLVRYSFVVIRGVIRSIMTYQVIVYTLRCLNNVSALIDIIQGAKCATPVHTIYGLTDVSLTNCITTNTKHSRNKSIASWHCEVRRWVRRYYIRKTHRRSRYIGTLD